MPEKTASACLARLAIVHGHWEGKKYLCSTVTRNGSPGIVPQAPVRSSDWLLIVVGVSGSKRSTGNETKRFEQHGKSRSKSIEMLDNCLHKMHPRCRNSSKVHLQGTIRSWKRGHGAWNYDY